MYDVGQEGDLEYVHDVLVLIFCFRYGRHVASCNYLIENKNVFIDFSLLFCSFFSFFG